NTEHIQASTCPDTARKADTRWTSRSATSGREDHNCYSGTTAPVHQAIPDWLVAAPTVLLVDVVDRAARDRIYSIASQERGPSVSPKCNSRSREQTEDRW